MIIIQVAGHIGKDPETRYTPAGLKVTTFSVATNIKRSQKEKTVWWKITCFGDRFDKKIAYLKKGSAVIVSGEMGIPDIWTDKSGTPQTNFEIVADIIQFNPFGRADREGGAPAGEQQDAQPSAVPAGFGANAVPVDDLPF